MKRFIEETCFIYIAGNFETLIDEVTNLTFRDSFDEVQTSKRICEELGWHRTENFVTDDAEFHQ